MPGVWDKLQLKDQKEVLVLNAPESFEPEIKRLKGLTIHRSLQGVKESPFSLAFVMTQPEVESAAKSITKLAKGDAVVWFAYPKGSSKRYTSTINRDNGWASLGAAGFEGVRMVAIDEDWSAVRFRKADFIKSMKRGSEWAMSAAGKAKASRPKGSRK
jgi:hypothetical protein